MTEADPIKRALALPSGARFYKCALQVNPFEYIESMAEPLPFPTKHPTIRQSSRHAKNRT